MTPARRGTAAAMLLLLVVAGCTGQDDDSPASPTQRAAAVAAPVEPCDITEPAVVADVFGGTVQDEKLGTSRNCSYAVKDGAAADVEVSYFGTADEWNGIKANYQVNRGPLTDLMDVGDDAFSPGDFRQNEVVVLAGDTVFSVGLGGVPTSTVVPEVKALAQRIAADLGHPASTR